MRVGLAPRRVDQDSHAILRGERRALRFDTNPVGPGPQGGKNQPLAGIAAFAIARRLVAGDLFQVGPADFLAGRRLDDEREILGRAGIFSLGIVVPGQRDRVRVFIEPIGECQRRLLRRSEPQESVRARGDRPVVDPPMVIAGRVDPDDASRILTRISVPLLP